MVFFITINTSHAKFLFPALQSPSPPLLPQYPPLTLDPSSALLCSQVHPFCETCSSDQTRCELCMSGYFLFPIPGSAPLCVLDCSKFHTHVPNLVSRECLFGKIWSPRLWRNVWEGLALWLRQNFMSSSWITKYMPWVWLSAQRWQLLSGRLSFWLLPRSKHPDLWRMPLFLLGVLWSEWLRVFGLSSRHIPQSSYFFFINMPHSVKRGAYFWALCCFLTFCLSWRRLPRKALLWPKKGAW